MEFQLNVETITIMLNLGALIWGAAKISSSVSHLDQTVTRLQKHMVDAGKERAEHDRRIAVLEYLTPGVRKAPPPIGGHAATELGVHPEHGEEE